MIEIELSELEELIKLAADLDYSEHCERGAGEYEENKLITELRKKYLENGDDAQAPARR